MKKKIAIIVATTLLIACLVVGLTSCSLFNRDKNDNNDKAYVGASVKKILEADYAGFEATELNDEDSDDQENSIYFRGNYATHSCDILSSYEYSQSQKRFYECYIRNDEKFSGSYDVYYDQDGNIEGTSDQSERKLELENFDYGAYLDFDAAKIGLAMMLSGYENFVRSKGEGYLVEAPDDGIWTGDVSIYRDDIGVFYDEKIKDMDFLDALHNITYFKYVTAPVSKDEFTHFLSALAGENAYSRFIVNDILEHGDFENTDSAYDYLMSAFDAMFADVHTGYANYVKEELYKQLGFEDSEFNGWTDADYCNNFFETVIVNAFYGDIFRVVTGDWIYYNTPVLSFNDKGELVGLKSSNKYYPGDDGGFGFILTFSKTPVELKNINDENAFYVWYDDESDDVTVYKDTVENFLNKSLDNIYHIETKTYDKFDSSFRKLRSKLNSDTDDYSIEYKIGNDVVAATYIADKGKVDIYYIAGEKDYFGNIDGEWWRFNIKKNSGWRRVKATSEPNVFTYDPYGYFMNPIIDQDTYYSLVEWKNSAYEFEIDGVRYRMTQDGSFSFKDANEKTVTLTYKSNSYLADTNVEQLGPDVEEAEPKPDKQVFDAALKASLEAKSVTYNNDNYEYWLDFVNNKSGYNSYYNTYYVFENGTLYEYKAEYGTYSKTESEKTYDAAFAYPVKDLKDCKYEDMEYDPFEETWNVEIDGAKYSFSFKNGYIEKLSKTPKNSSRTQTYEFSNYNKTTIELPKIRLSDEELRAALKKSFEASSYEAKRFFEQSGLTIVEQFDHKNQLANAKWTNSKNVDILNILRAVSDGKVWMYSDASGQWLRAELDSDPATYIDDVSELMSFKRDVESKFSSENYTFNWDQQKDEYTFKNSNFDCVITVKNGYLATLGLKSGADTVLEFSKYNEVSLSLPKLGQADETVRAEFAQAIENSANASNFRMKFDAIMSDIPLTLTTDVIKGERALTTGTLVYPAGTVPSGYPTEVDLLQVYREWSDDITTTWTRNAEPTMDMTYKFGAWSQGMRAPEPDEAHKADLWYYNFAQAIVDGGMPLDVLFVLSKYDERTKEYVVRGYDPTDMHIVEYRFKVQDGFISEVTITDKAILQSMNLQNESLTIRYSGYNETTLDRPEGVN